MEMDNDILGSIADHDKEAALLLLYYCASGLVLADFTLSLFLPALHS